MLRAGGGVDVDGHDVDVVHESDGATADRDGRSAIVAGAGGRSDVITRVLSTDPDTRMPPPGTGKSLTPSQVTLLRRWIKAGAVYEGHWAYERLSRPAPPAAAVGDAPAGPIDAFVGRDLARHGLAAVVEADRSTLVRRLFFGLTGLPPTPADVARRRKTSPSMPPTGCVA